MKQITLFGASVHTASMSETVAAIDNRIKSGEFTQHAVVNVAKLVNMQADRELRDSVLGCDIINIDGMGVVWAARFLGLDVSERVAGIDLFDKLISLSARKKYPVFLLGAESSVVHKTAEILRTQHIDLNIVGCHHGYFWNDEEAIVREIKDSGAKLLFVAITSPKKENFINKWKNRLGVQFVMGVGGTFDIIAGKTKRAPVWMQEYGLEWFYRIVQEPGRMWKRYLVTNVKFACLLLAEKIKVIMVRFR